MTASQTIAAFEKPQLRGDLPQLRPGDNVKVHVRIVEGEKERIQIFQGTVIRVKRGTVNATFTVRKVSYGVGVERVFPYHSPRVAKIEVIGHAHVRRARLFYLRELKGKAARLRDARRAGLEEAIGTNTPEPGPEVSETADTAG